MPMHLLIMLMLLQAMYLLHAVLGNFLTCVPFARLDSKELLHFLGILFSFLIYILLL